MSTESLNFTEPTIVTTDNLSHRSFISFSFDNKPQRLYHGKNVGQQIDPNRAKTLEEKLRLLKKLQFQLHKILEANNYPIVNELSKHKLKLDSKVGNHQLPIEPLNQEATAGQLLLDALNKKLASSLSKTYKRDLKSIYKQFTSYALPTELEGALEAINTIRVEAFLSQFGSSGTYYMNKRRNLAILFAVAGRFIDKPIKAVKDTERRRTKAKLHVAYDKEQLRPILSYLKANYPKLHICCLLTYASWLRPHEEVRLLVPENFKKNNTEVHLSGNENKGGKVRVVYIPDYVRVEIEPLLTGLERGLNLFSRKRHPLNESYFNTQWSRAYKKMALLGLIFPNQTIYSFRHTAAVDTYRRTKDVYLLQKLLGHSSIVVTLKYLRSLGEFNSDELRDAAPQLD